MAPSRLVVHGESYKTFFRPVVRHFRMSKSIREGSHLRFIYYPAMTPNYIPYLYSINKVKLLLMFVADSRVVAP